MDSRETARVASERTAHGHGVRCDVPSSLRVNRAVIEKICTEGVERLRRRRSDPAHQTRYAELHRRRMLQRITRSTNERPEV